MKHSREVQRIHWGTAVTAVRVEGLKPGPAPDSLEICDVDDEAAVKFRVIAVCHDQFPLTVAEYEIIPLAREHWLARTMAMACAAEMSNKFKVPVSDI